MPLQHSRYSPRKGADQGDKLVELRGARPGQHRTKEHGAGPENVLLPLDARVVLAAAREESRLHDTHGWEKLKRNGKQDRNGVYCLCQRTIRMSHRRGRQGAGSVRPNGNLQRN